MKVLVPPLKCQGIKTKLVPWIQSLAGTSFGRWIEPFMGSGVVGFNMRSPLAIFGDSNPHIITFYKALQSGEITPLKVKSYLQYEGDLLRVASNEGYEHYKLIRDRFNVSGSSLDFLFLSRAGFNGMMRFSKKGNWNIPFCKKPNRFSKAYVTKIVNQVEAITQVIQKDWTFVCQDYLTTITTAQKGDLIYCDPPYLGRYTDYFNNWTETDEYRLAEALKATPARFILSSWHHNEYRENVSIKQYWNKFNVITRDHFYHSGGKKENRKAIVEALICNFDVQNIEVHNHGLSELGKQLILI